MSTDRLATAWAIFQGLLLESLPFLLLGVLIAGLARWLVPQGTWLSRMPQMRVAHLMKNQICFTMRVSASLAAKNLIQIRGWSGLGKIIT